MTDVTVTLDVGGTIFKAKMSCLLKCEMFKQGFKDSPYKGEVVHIDRCGHIFKHVLGYLRNSRYRYPEKYLDELNYYYIDMRRVNVLGDKRFHHTDTLKKGAVDACIRIMYMTPILMCLSVLWAGLLQLILVLKH